MNLKKVIDRVKEKLAKNTTSNKEDSRIDKSHHVQISEKEAKRLEKDLDVKIPKINSKGDITFEGNTIGFANNFSGVCITDKDFAKKNLKDVLWYVN